MSLPERDTFSVGDKVKCISKMKRPQFGDDTLIVKDIIRVPASDQRNVGHTQWLIFEGDPSRQTYSGFHFEKQTE